MKNRISLMCSAMAMVGAAAFGTGCSAEADDTDLAENDVIEGEGAESIAEAESAFGWDRYGVFYDNHDYRGRWMMVRYPYNIRSFRDFRDGYWDNRIASFRLHNGGRFRLYNDYGWGGDYRDFRRDVRNLYDWDFDRRGRSLWWY